MVEFTNEDLEMINAVMTNKFSNGAYSGMILNNVLLNRDLTIDEVIKKALEVRQRLDELSSQYKKKEPKILIGVEDTI